jgi:hypothetical protein
LAEQLKNLIFLPLTLITLKSMNIPQRRQETEYNESKALPAQRKMGHYERKPTNQRHHCSLTSKIINV